MYLPVEVRVGISKQKNSNKNSKNRKTKDYIYRKQFIIIMISRYITTALAVVVTVSCISFISTANAFKQQQQPSKKEVTTIIEGQLLYPIVDRTATDANNLFLPYNRTTKITLNHGIDYVTYSNEHTGKFTIRNIKPGIHIIDIHDVNYHFPQIKCQYKINNDIDINSGEATASLTCLEYLYPGAVKQSITVQPILKIYSTSQYNYFEKRKGFSLMSIVSNPMILLMAFTAGMMLLMPKMMEGMDDEERERVKKQMAMQNDPSKMLNELWGSISGTGNPEPSSSSSSTTPSITASELASRKKNQR